MVASAVSATVDVQGRQTVSIACSGLTHVSATVYFQSHKFTVSQWGSIIPNEGLMPLSSLQQ